MATACHVAYIPSVTSKSIRSLVDSQKHQKGSCEYNFVVTEDEAMGIVETSATEAALDALVNELSQK